ncbi:uncharacterized protein LOC123293028 [Chrysoperla carnea]|uniref:uncharacterized protein LOC123293028 n=1 Tax=Chrysoperla carnea TaxID=189513 RepID=UPI001D093643|nr:uncharacterized protein LOC123293028 [Chrysoperla carnea]
MAFNFRAEQFDTEFNPTNLGNWEVPKWYPDKPCIRKGCTKIISNDQGHILPGLKKTSSPWGNYIGTWQLPKRITREIANELNRPDPEKVEARRRKYLYEKKYLEKNFGPNRFVSKDKSISQTDKDNTTTTLYVNKREADKSIAYNDENKPLIQSASILSDEERTNLSDEERLKLRESPANINLATLPKVENDDNNKPYTPGDLTSPRHRHHSHEMLKSTPNEKLTLPQINQSHERLSHTSEDQVPPEVQIAIHNFQTAKTFHRENLEHQPLPETVTDPYYRRLQMQGHQHPGIALKIEPIVTGVGYKPYGGYSPTQCTKLKVYRPKTCTPCSKQDRHIKNNRPSTTDKRRSVHTIIQKDITPIELAICWDVIPENPEDEPKRPVHIDGSNGSAAPAVFTKVYSPKPEDEHAESTRIHTQSFFEKVENPQRDPGDNDDCDMNHHQRAKTAWCGKTDKDLCNHIKQMKISDNGHDGKHSDNASHSSSNKDSKKSSKSNSHNSHSAYKNNDAVNDRILERQNHHSHSSPNLSVYGDKEKIRPKSEYKMAFKAGKPNSSSSDSNSYGSHKPYICVPKPRDPFVRKNYRITTLAPPFCLKPEKRDCEYPEHWRLASVYQHSYKPMQTRKRPLLASVYN